MDIIQKKLDDLHTSSFWFDGLVAMKGEFKLYAMGDINILFNQGESTYSDGNAVQEALQRGYTDKDLSKAIWENNNWFEVLDGNGISNGDLEYSYDEAIEMLDDLTKTY